MKACTRCGGYVHFQGYSDADPECVNCGCQFPGLKQSNGNKRHSQGLRSVMRYSGTNKSMKELVGYVTLKVHPSPGIVYPLLEIECPSCGTLAIAKNSETNPEAMLSSRIITTEADFVASRYIYCKQGHSIRLKVDKIGRYTWD